MVTVSFGGGDRDRKPFGDRAPREGGGERSFGGGAGDRDRKPFSGGGDRDRKPFGDRAPREGGGTVAALVAASVKPSVPAVTVSRLVIVPRVRAAVSVSLVAVAERKWRP